MKIFSFAGICVLFLFAAGCSAPSAQSEENTEKPPVEAEINPILTKLAAVKGRGILFGHQDDLAYGVGWKYIEGESDVKRISGDYPALFGWELGGIEGGDRMNLDSVPFDTMRNLAEKAHAQGGINTFSWHPYSAVNGVNSWNGDSVVVKHILPGGSHHAEFTAHLDKLADFFLALKTETGQAMPFIFRPWHEMDGDWFWWGKKACSPDELKQLFRFSVTYLREKKGLDRMLIAYSPDRNFDSRKEYLSWYPGDDAVDILGMDNYYDFKQKGGEKDVIRKLKIVIETAKSKNKPAALTETGSDQLLDSLWFTQKLGLVLSDSLVRKELSYTMVWRNGSEKHFFFPYPGHPAAEDAKKMLSRPDILLLREFTKMLAESEN